MKRENLTRVTAIALGSLLALSLAACGGSSTKSATQSTAPASTSQPADTNQSAGAPAETTTPAGAPAETTMPTEAPAETTTPMTGAAAPSTTPTVGG